jgi:hypothetical protein
MTFIINIYLHIAGKLYFVIKIEILKEDPFGIKNYFRRYIYNVLCNYLAIVLNCIEFIFKYGYRFMNEF